MTNNSEIEIQKQLNEIRLSLLVDHNSLASILLRKLKPGLFRLLDISVKEDSRCMGHGKRLVEETRQYLKQTEGHGIIYVEYGTWMSSDSFMVFMKKMNYAEEHYEYTTMMLPLWQLKEYGNRIPCYSTNSLYQIKSFSDLSAIESSTLLKAQETAPKYLTHISKDIIPRLSYTVFDNSGNCLGWLIIERKKNILRLVASFNNGNKELGVGLLLWNTAIQNVDDDLLKEAEWLSFDFDKTNQRTLRLYMTIFEGVTYRLFDTYSRSIPF